MKNDTGRIYTSSWFTRLPPNMLRIGISRGTPQRQPAGFRRLPELTPGPWFNSVSADEYHRRYMAQLAGLDPKAVLARISDMAAGHDVALLCYESPTDPAKWCHRGHVSAWLADTLGIEVFEYGLEDQGCGWQHPKLLPELRRPSHGAGSS
jgi:hypothetical protein